MYSLRQCAALRDDRCAEQPTALQRFKLEEASLLSIRAEMPTTNDSWEVERVAQYRCQYGIEQWLVKWKGYEEDRNTWEQWDNLLMREVQSEAVDVREAALQPRTQAGLHARSLWWSP